METKQNGAKKRIVPIETTKIATTFKLNAMPILLG